MARPVQANAEQTRARILDAAARLFADLGAGQSSVRAIAREAGLSLAMIHHYYGSKDELYLACIDHMYQDLFALRGELVSTMQEGGAPDQALTRAARAGFRFARSHQQAVRLVTRAILDSGELNAAWRKAAFLPFLEQVSTAIGMMVGRPAATLRLPLQSLVFLITRYAVVTEAEMCRYVGIPENAVSDAVAAIEEHLVDATLTLLAIDKTAGKY